MYELKWYTIVIATTLPSLGIFVGAWLALKLLEVIHKIMEPKIGTAIKRVVTVTIIDQDVDNLEEILRHFAKESTHKDRRLIGFAKRFLDKINEQRRQIRLLEYEDQKTAMKEFFADLDEERLSEVEGQQGEQILTLTDVVDKEELPQIEDAATK